METEGEAPAEESAAVEAEPVARSPTLAAALGPNWESEGRWQVIGAGPEATRAMLDFLQDGEVPSYRKVEEMVEELLHIATFYQLPDLQEAAKKALLRLLNTSINNFPEGLGDILSYTPTLVTIQSFSITSTREYFFVFGPPLERRPNIFLYWAS